MKQSVRAISNISLIVQMTSGTWRQSIGWRKQTHFLIIIIGNYGFEQVVVMRAVHVGFVHDAIEVEGWYVKDGPLEGRIEIIIGGGIGRAREAPPRSGVYDR